MKLSFQAEGMTRRDKILMFNWKVFAVAFVFSFVVGVLALSSFYLFLFYPTLNLQIWVMSLIRVVSFFISPLMLFVSFYLLGRNIDLESNFLSVFVSLFSGSWAGQLAYYVIYVYTSHLWVSAPLSTLPSILFMILWSGFTLAFSFEFFVGFTGLAMAYIVKKRGAHDSG